MRKYHQLTSGERYELSALRKQGLSQREIARAMDRAPSTISREVRRNSKPDGGYRPDVAGEKTRGRRSRSRRNQQFTLGDWVLVVFYLKQLWSPEQISGTLKMKRQLWISHETIYRYVWDDRARGGTLYRYLRQALKKRRKGYAKYDSRGILAGKRALSERPPGAENRSRVGHFEGDTVMGSGDTHCIVTLVDRTTGYVIIGKLESRRVVDTNRRAIELIERTCRRVRTVTVDNGTEFHGFKDIEASTGALFYFAAPYHSWERGTSENTNGLIRQYLPKRTSMAHVTQDDCDRIAHQLNTRPRKRLGYLTPEQCYENQLSIR
jgi:IS30 family transposase